MKRFRLVRYGIGLIALTLEQRIASGYLRASKGKPRNCGVLCPRETTALEHPHSGLRARGRYREGTYPDNLLATRPEHVQVLR